jgi:hypothetical protein
MRDGALTRYFRLIGMLGRNERVDTDYRSVPQLQEDKSNKIDQAKKLFDMGVPLNKAVDFVNLGLDEIPGGDIGYLPSQFVPVDQLPYKPGGVLLGQSPLHTEQKHNKGTQYGSEEHEKVYKRLQSRLDNPVSAIKRIIKREFQRQQNEINRRLREGKTYGRGLFKDEVENIPDPESLFDLEEEIKKIIEALKETLFSAVNVIGEDELAALGLRGVFDITRPEVVAQVMQILRTVARKTNETTWENLVDIFQQAERAGEGIPAIQERLSEFFGDRKSDWQTERIARTTMTGASNAGSWQAYQQAQDNGLQLQKEWVSALQPSRSRESHMEAHGQVVGINEAFTVDGEALMYPGDPAGLPGNIINCLCGMIAKVKE